MVAGPRWEPDTKIDWPTDRRSKYNFDFNFNFECDLVSYWVSEWVSESVKS
jgi:hypothetical protein